MEKILWTTVPIVLMMAGVYLLVRPAEAAEMSRDNKEDTSPLSSGEIWRTRITGLFMLVAGAAVLCQMLFGAPPAPDFDPVQF
jgi:hypothetical protein